jgi:DNA-binding transcriptional ArsR family regulator
MSNQSADAVFDALGEPVRRRILELLREGPTPVGRLAERLPVGRPAVSKHLRVLSNAGLIEHRSVGTRNLYALAPDGMATAQQWLASLRHELCRYRIHPGHAHRIDGTDGAAGA